jgi:dihydrofolate reductase
MRKIIVAEFMSLDGVVEAPDTWHFPYLSDEMFDIMWAMNAESDTMLLGRVTYETFAAFGSAPADDPIAGKMNRPAKVVVSATIDNPTWGGNSSVLTGDVVAGVRALKEQPGEAILITGSIRLVQTLLRAGLVDELNLLVHPIVVGPGRRLFAEDGPQIPLQLAHATTLGTGVVHAVYRTV